MTNPHDKAIEAAAEALLAAGWEAVGETPEDAAMIARSIMGGIADDSADDARIARLAARAAIAAYERAMWRPIEEAPKDGTYVLVAFHHDVPARASGFAEKFAVMRWSFGGGEWSYHRPIGMGGFPDVWLTGFRPLPPVPEGE